MFPSRNLPTKPPGAFPWCLEFCSESTHRFQTELRSLRASGSLHTWFPQPRRVSSILAKQDLLPLRAIGLSLKCHPQEGLPLTIQLKVGHVPSLLLSQILPSFGEIIQNGLTLFICLLMSLKTTCLIHDHMKGELCQSCFYPLISSI